VTTARSREILPLKSEQDIVIARQAVRKLTIELGFGTVGQTKLVTAASELGRNALVHGGGGEVTLELLAEGGRNGIRVTFTDQGRGIPDIEQALRDGYSTDNGMGLGLGGSKRLVDEFVIHSTPCKGTQVTIVCWK
jgi:serine/threonine-protein kinase RsbT